VALLGLITALSGGCPIPPAPNAPVFNNTTDPTNGGASFIGSAACAACHPDIHARTRIHGHTYALNRTENAPPAYAPEGTRAGVPQTPDATTFADVSYVIGGYTHDALYLDQNGFIMTDASLGAPTQWDLAFPVNGTAAGFAANLFDQPTPLPYEFSCFRCHTVGPQEPSAGAQSQDGRPGVHGTWAEPGVQCEACHGPGSNHIPRPEARTEFVDSSARLCAGCHTAGPDPNEILASGGFISVNTQYAELLASGGHSTFSCGVCHDPHASANYDRSNAIRNSCPTCHGDHGIPLHLGVTFQRGDYSEPIGCESCHMPLATLTGSIATAAAAGTTGHFADTRTHIFRIDPSPIEASAFFTADGTRVVKDETGRAAVPVVFVCLRCHNDTSTPNTSFNLPLVNAAQLATNMHQKFDQFPPPSPPIARTSPAMADDWRTGD
jgi:hypothetical protein